MQKLWSIATSSLPKASVGARTSKVLGWSEYSVVWSYTGGQGHTRVAHWDSLVISANHYCLVSVQHNKLLQVLVLT